MKKNKHWQEVTNILVPSDLVKEHLHSTKLDLKPFHIKNVIDLSFFFLWRVHKAHSLIVSLQLWHRQSSAGQGGDQKANCHLILTWRMSLSFSDVDLPNLLYHYSLCYSHLSISIQQLNLIHFCKQWSKGYTIDMELTSKWGSNLKFELWYWSAVLTSSANCWYKQNHFCYSYLALQNTQVYR